MIHGPIWAPDSGVQGPINDAGGTCMLYSKLLDQYLV